MVNMQRTRPHLSGFTMIELLVVMAIIATLLSLVAPRYYHSVDKAKEVVLKQNLATMREIIDKYHGDTGKYPANLEALIEKRYLRSLPIDPITERDDTWKIIPPDNPEYGGMYDIKSGAPGKGSDGRPYADW